MKPLSAVFAIGGVLLIIWLVDRLLRRNPFMRYLRKPAYSLARSTFRRVSNLVEISFDFSHADDSKRIFREALYACMYTYPDTRSISFRGLGRLAISDRDFESFQFECLDFSNIPASDFNIFEPLYLPASYIILPKDSSEVSLRYCHPDLECIAIPSQHFVPAKEYYTFDPSGKPILVNSDFHIKVPENLLREYRTDPVWNSIKLIDETGRIFHPTFSPYWGI